MNVADDRYNEGYWERGEGSNYVGYADDPGWWPTAAILSTELGPTAMDATLLEFGAAKGYFVAAALRQGFDAYGVDPSEWAIDHRAPRLADHRLRLGNAQTYRSDRHDVVCSWEVLEHVDEADVQPALANMWAHVMPGGLFVHRICLPGAMEDHDHTHVTMYPREWWEDEIWLACPGAERLRHLEKAFDNVFADRDWAGRYFAYRRGSGV